MQDENGRAGVWVDHAGLVGESVAAAHREAAVLRGRRTAGLSVHASTWEDESPKQSAPHPEHSGRSPHPVDIG
eukprot:1596354-Prymnesium_polylepis.1